jgi:hypothetical protein
MIIGLKRFFSGDLAPRFMNFFRLSFTCVVTYDVSSFSQVIIRTPNFAFSVIFLMLSECIVSPNGRVVRPTADDGFPIHPGFG